MIVIYLFFSVHGFVASGTRMRYTYGSSMTVRLLQKWILHTCYDSKTTHVPRGMFLSYYNTHQTAKPENRERIITQSLEGLIDRGILVGYGVRTPKKWFIREVRLTPLGKCMVKKSRDRRQQLPLK